MNLRNWFRSSSKNCPISHSWHTATKRVLRSRLAVEKLESRDVPSAVFVPSQSGGLDAPRALTFGPDGDLFVVSSADPGAVLRYDGSSGASLGAFVVPGSGGLNEPFDLTFGPDGNLYVSSFSTVTNAINRYDGTSGTYLDTFVTASSGGLTRPTGLVFDSAGDLLVSSYDSGQVLKYRGPNNGAAGHPAGESLGVFASTGVGSSPDFLTFGPDGKLYVGCLTI